MARDGAPPLGLARGDGAPGRTARPSSEPVRARDPGAQRFHASGRWRSRRPLPPALRDALPLRALQQLAVRDPPRRPGRASARADRRLPHQSGDGPHRVRLVPGSRHPQERPLLLHALVQLHGVRRGCSRRQRDDHRRDHRALLGALPDPHAHPSSLGQHLGRRDRARGARGAALRSEPGASVRRARAFHRLHSGVRLRVPRSHAQRRDENHALPDQRAPILL